MRMMKRIAVLLLPLFLTGCGTLMVRDFPSGRSHGLYPATGCDVMMATTGGGMWQTGDCDNAPVWARVVGWTVVAPLHVVDIPISVLADTIYLPADIRWSRIDEEARSREFRMNVAQISTNAPSIVLVSVSPYPETHARFRLLEAGELVDVKVGGILRCPAPQATYTLLYGDSTQVILRKERE